MKHFGVILALVLGFWGFQNPGYSFGAEGFPVFVSILPQKYFVEKIGGDLVEVSVMVPPGASAATYEPKPAQMKTLSGTKIYYAIGVPFERAWLKKIAATNSQMRIVHTEKGIEKRSLALHPQKDPWKDGETGKESHNRGLKDPHIWLSPPLVMVQARIILMTLLESDPTHRAKYEANFARFMMELLEIDAEIRGIFSEKKEGKGITFMVFHPSWGYFADAYGLKQIPIEVEGKDPKPAQMKALIEIAEEEAIKVIFVQPQFSTKRAEIIAKAIGGRIIRADPLAEDWANNLRNQAIQIMAASRERH